MVLPRIELIDQDPVISVIDVKDVELRELEENNGVGYLSNSDGDNDLIFKGNDDKKTLR